MIGAGYTAGRFQAVLGLDTKDYAKGIINAQTLNKVFGESFTAFVANPVLGGVSLLGNLAGVALSVGTSFLKATRDQISYAESLQRLAQQTGASEQLLLALEKRLQVAGMSGEIGSKSILKLAQGLQEFRRGAGPIKEVADANRIFIDQNADIETTLSTVLDGIMKIEDQSRRSAAASKIFGEEAGPKLLNAIGGGSLAIQQMIRESEMLGYRVDSVANDKIAALNTQLDYLKLSSEAIKYNAINAFLTGLTRDADSSKDSILALTASINSGLTPTATLLGERIGPLLEAAPGAIYTAAVSLDLIIQKIERLIQIYEASPLDDILRWGANAGQDLGAAQFNWVSNRFSDMYSVARGAASRNPMFDAMLPQPW